MVEGDLERPAKRQRPELHNDGLDTPIPLRERTKLSDLWFEDGGLVLATSTHIFRVYKGALAQKSEFFQTQLSLPQSTEEGDNGLFGGARIVHLADNREDVEVFLKAFFNPK